jgi:hypothetical protein
MACDAPYYKTKLHLYHQNIFWPLPHGYTQGVEETEASPKTELYKKQLPVMNCS